MCSLHILFLSGMLEPSGTESTPHGFFKAIVSRTNICYVCMYVYVCMYICMYVCMYVCVCVCVCRYVCMYVCMCNRFEQRLLHPGANTADIITQYISAIRSLKVLDPTGVIIERVCQPIKDYLR